ncbi:MAG: DUF4097 family beta strand repeat-containing protein [Candidatus Cloacimonetes bacterium]|nr:DUF4097 family beta strand repeat-containing protein [Candidatus Cloacimonadota bacterium]
MKTAKIDLNYDFGGKDTVEITNNMAPLHIGRSESGQVEIRAELSIPSFVPGTDFAEYFHVDEDGKTLEIGLERIPELKEAFMGTGRSQVWVKVPSGAAVIAKTDNMPIKAEGIAGALVLHNENGPLKLDGCEGHIHLQNENGPIKLHSCEGDFEIRLENGPLSAEKISGANLEVNSENGPVKIRLASVSRVKISNENGVIYYESLPLESGEMDFVNENGIINLVLAQDQNFELDAETNVGSISTSLGEFADAEDGHKTIRQGEGGLKISVKTENGVIKLNANGSNDMNFVKMKLKDLKGAIGSAVGEEDMERVQKTLESATAAVEKAIGSINEEKIKEKLSGALGKLQKAVEGFDFKETSDKVVKTVDQIGDEVTDTLKIVLRKVKDSDDRTPKEHFASAEDYSEPGILKEFIRKTVDAAIAKTSGKGLSDCEKQAVDERSRAKILEMLESGKITAEEAERLLKAIGRE